MSEDEFVSFVRETEGVELKDYNQEGGGLFVEIMDVDVRDELSEMAEECGYTDFGEMQQVGTGEIVRLFIPN